MKTICLDPGHGLGNRSAGKYDPGAVSNGVEEASVAMAWANNLRQLLIAKGCKVIRTRRDHKDPAPVGKRAGIAREYGCQILVSLHTNAATGTAQGTETFYRGAERKSLAKQLNDAVVEALDTRDRGVKTEGQSQHARLAVMAFQPCFLLELGFIDHAGDRAKMLDPVLRHKACEKLAEILVAA
jgi:N-acetylmuramoyl-L-alanine amidase